MDDHSREQLQEFSGKTETSKSTNELRTSTGYKSRGREVMRRGRGNHMRRGGREGLETMIKDFGQQGRGRARNRDGFMNGFGPIRRGRGRSLPYMNMREKKLGRADAMGMCGGPPPLPSSPLPPPFPPPPLPMHLRGPHPPMHRHGPPPPPPLPPPPPPRHPPFRGCPRGRGMMPLGSHHHFHPRGYHNGPPPLPPPHLPPGRGQRWPGPPAGWRF